MIINVTPRYRIESDIRSWAISHRGKDRKSRDTGEIEPNWVMFNWCDSLPSAIQRLAEILTREDPLVTDSLSEALQRAETIAESVRASAVRDRVATKAEKRLQGLGIQ